MRQETKDTCQESEERQRRSVLQPRVARNELPWVDWTFLTNPNGVVPSVFRCGDATLSGLRFLYAVTQGSRFAPTLGWETERCWRSDSRRDVGNLIFAVSFDFIRLLSFLPEPQSELGGITASHQ